jgi:HAD hydrolase, family IIB
MTHQNTATRLVAVDMDGTFLDDEGDYDRDRFAAIHARMRDAGIRFVIASGNQHGALSAYFDDYPDVLYVAENGALVAAGDDVWHTTAFEPADLDAALALVTGLPEVFVLVCCASTAYALRTSDPGRIAGLARYYANVELVDDWDQVPDPVLKLAMGCRRDETTGLLEHLRDGLPAGAVPTSSGHGSIDVIPAGTNKGVALAWLGDRLGIRLADMVAFGDGGNDVEMLRSVGTGVAMANASEPVKRVCDDTTDSNNAQGVLSWLESHPELWGSGA